MKTEDYTKCGNHQLGCDCTNWEEKYAYVDFKFTIPSKGKTDEELLEYAREELYYDMHGIIKDLVRNGGTVAEAFDREEAVDYGMEEE